MSNTVARIYDPAFIEWWNNQTLSAKVALAVSTLDHCASAWEAAREAGLTPEQSAALKALVEWREAEKTVNEARERWQKDASLYAAYCAAQVRAKESRVALRAAADSLQEK